MAEELKRTIQPNVRKTVKLYLAVFSIVMILMMIFGFIMLLNQAGQIRISPSAFYQIMSLHGTGMVGTAALGGSAMMWYFLNQYVPLNNRIFSFNLILSLIGIVMILVAVIVFHYPDAWTFLYPLPSVSAKQQGSAGPLFFLFGLLILGIGYILVYMEAARGIRKTYDGVIKGGLGWNVIFSKDKHYGPPGAVVASSMVVIANTIGILAGAYAIVISIINIVNPNISFDPLIAKATTYAFGHVFANCTIYMAVAGVYEILSMKTKRPWKANKAFLIAWNFSTLFTVLIYTHHLLMDFAVPEWLLLMGQIFSYANALPVLIVTAYGTLMIVFKSEIKWDMASGLMFLSMCGWAVGAIPAVIDSTIVVNDVMHNTKWVPGHFHTYMGMGVITMVIGFMYYIRNEEGRDAHHDVDRIGMFVYFLFFTGLIGTFLFSGKISVPRRWAQHFPEWIVPDYIGAICGIFIASVMIFFTVRYFTGIRKSIKD